MDSFEKHMKEIRDKMDLYEPDPSLWGRIEKDIRAKHLTGRVLLRWAAVLIIVAGAGLALIYRSNAIKAEQEKSAMKIVRETEQYYNSLIKSLYTEAEPMLTANPEVKTELNLGMNELDSICANIRKDLKDNVATEEVVEALICNYRLRIELLEDMLRIMREEETNNETKKNYEL